MRDFWQVLKELPVEEKEAVPGLFLTSVGEYTFDSFAKVVSMRAEAASVPSKPL